MGMETGYQSRIVKPQVDSPPFAQTPFVFFTYTAGESKHSAVLSSLF